MADEPSTMRAVLLTGHGGPEMLEYREDWPVPVPAAGRGTGQGHRVRGEQHRHLGARRCLRHGRGSGCGVLLAARRSDRVPADPGRGHRRTHASVGARIDGGIIGKRVMVDFGIYNDTGPSLSNVDYIGHGRHGGFEEYCAVPAENAHVVETPLGDAELATFCCAYVTAERMLARARVTGGEIVLVTGASGGVGTG